VTAYCQEQDLFFARFGVLEQFKEDPAIVADRASPHTTYAYAVKDERDLQQAAGV